MKFIWENKFTIGVMILTAVSFYSAAAQHMDYARSIASNDNVVMESR